MMSMTSKILTALAVILVAVGAIWWIGIRDSGTVPEPVAEVVEETPPVSTETPAVFRSSKSPRPITPVTQPTAAANTVMTDWEDHVDTILGDDTPVEDKARKMLELFPNFPEAGQVETAQHISNLLADEDYDKFGRYLTNSASPVGVQDIVLSDVLNRPNDIKLPLLFETARNPANAKSEEAKEMLGLYLQEDYGDDWKKWQDEMEKYLKENPE